MRLIVDRNDTRQQRRSYTTDKKSEGLEGMLGGTQLLVAIYWIHCPLVGEIFNRFNGIWAMNDSPSIVPESHDLLSLGADKLPERGVKIHNFYFPQSAHQIFHPDKDRCPAQAGAKRDFLLCQQVGIYQNLQRFW